MVNTIGGKLKWQKELLGHIAKNKKAEESMEQETQIIEDNDKFC